MFDEAIIQNLRNLSPLLEVYDHLPLHGVVQIDVRHLQEVRTIWRVVGGRLANHPALGRDDSLAEHVAEEGEYLENDCTGILFDQNCSGMWHYLCSNRALTGRTVCEEAPSC